MLVKRLFGIERNSKYNINFFQKPKTIPKNRVILSQSFLYSTIEDARTKDFPGKFTYYREYLLSRSEYANLIFCKNTETNSKTAAILSRLGQEKENELYVKDELSSHLNKELSEFSFNEFCEATFLILQYIIQNRSDPFWEGLLFNINAECLRRIPSWTTDEKIKMTDVMTTFRINVSSRKTLLLKLLKLIIRSTSTKDSFILFYYFLMKKQFVIPQGKKFFVQKKIEEIIPDSNSIEVGILCEGFLQSSLQLQYNGVLSKILVKAVEESETIHKIPFYSICRFTQAFTSRAKLSDIKEFQQKMMNRALACGVPSVVHLALIGVQHGYLDSNLRNILMKEVKDHISELSLNEIERVAYLGTVFEILDEEFLKLAVDVFVSAGDVERKNQSFFTFLTHLINFRKYPKQLFDLVLNQEFVDNIHAQTIKKMHAWWFVYCSLRIEKPDCIAIDLDQRALSKACNVCTVFYLLSQPSHQKRLFELRKKLEQAFGEETTYYLRPLPHYQLGLLIIFDKHAKPQKLPEEFEVPKKGHVIKPLNDGHMWTYFFIDYLFDLKDCSDPPQSFIQQTNLRQLHAIGYVPVPVNNVTFKIKETKIDFNSLISARLEEFFKDKKDAVSS